MDFNVTIVKNDDFRYQLTRFLWSLFEQHVLKKFFFFWTFQWWYQPCQITSWGPNTYLKVNNCNTSIYLLGMFILKMLLANLKNWNQMQILPNACLFHLQEVQFMQEEEGEWKAISILITSSTTSQQLQFNSKKGMHKFDKCKY